jgi:hypothetical protein
LAGNRYFRRWKMKTMKFRTLCSLLALASCAACNPDDSNRSRGPIVLGDSSTIVTEADPEALRDVVADLQVPAEQLPEAPASATDTAATNAGPSEANATQQSFAGDGLTISFQELKVFFPKIGVRGNKTDLKTARSGTFELQRGNLAGNKLQIAPAAGKINKVSQRYETVAGLEDGTGSLALEGLGKYRSSWSELSATGGAYAMTGLDKPEFHDVSTGTFRNAVQQQAKRERMNRQETQQLLDKAKNYRSIQQAPARITLTAVLWRIEGEDAKGKRFTKELRIDIPR